MESINNQKLTRYKMTRERARKMGKDIGLGWIAFGMALLFAPMIKLLVFLSMVVTGGV